MQDHAAALRPRAIAVGATLSIVGLLGLLPGRAGAFDPVTFLAWLALWAPVAGLVLGASGARFVPAGISVGGVWGFALVLSDANSERDLAGPLWALLVVVGFFGAGQGLGALLRRRCGARAPDVAGPAGALLVVGLLLTGLCVQGGLSEAGPSWGADDPSHPPGRSPRQRFARVALELSPVVLVLESAGWDVTHAHPSIYHLSGVEWLERRPYRGMLAGPAALVVGCALAGLLGRRSRRQPGEAFPADL